MFLDEFGKLRHEFLEGFLKATYTKMTNFAMKVLNMLLVSLSASSSARIVRILIEILFFSFLFSLLCECKNECEMDGRKER